MSTEVTRMLVEIKKATVTAHGGGRLAQMVRERLVLGGADTMALLDASVDLRSTAAVVGFGGHIDLSTTQEAEAGQFSVFGLAVMRAARWLKALGKYPLCAPGWLTLFKLLAAWLTPDRFWTLAEPGGSDAIAAFDPAARTAFMGIDLSALVGEWQSGAVEGAGRIDDGWPTIACRNYGDPRFNEGQFVTLYALPTSPLKTMRGINNTYDRGRSSSTT